MFLPEGVICRKKDDFLARISRLKPGPAPAVSPEFLQLLMRERRSVRLFNDQPVSKDQLEKIIDAGRYAPTGSTRQDVNYIVLSDVEKIAELRSLIDRFMQKTFKLLQNRIIAFFYRMKFGQLGLQSLLHYGMWYEFLLNKK